MEPIVSINEAAVPKNARIAINFGLTVFNGKLFNFSKLKILSQIQYYYLSQIQSIARRDSIVCNYCSIIRNKPNSGSAENCDINGYIYLFHH